MTLLVISALVVDLANARQHRTQLQTAADAAALAAAQDLPNQSTALQTAKSIAADNYGLATDAWAGCHDPDHLLEIPDLVIANTCISFNTDGTLVRVRLPDQAIATFFGSAVGRDNIEVNASATAANHAPATERVVPAAVTAVMGTGLLCLENSGNDIDCAARSTGNFGSIYSPRVNVFHPSDNSRQTSEAINYAMNVDHDLQPWDGAEQRICDGPMVSPCDSSNQLGASPANWLVVSTGNDVPPVTEGFVTGFKAQTTDMGTIEFCGRLSRPDFTAVNALNPYPDNCAPGQPTITAAGTEINGRHAYYWMTDEARKVIYPEAASLGLADTDPNLAVGASIYDKGDERLECYLAGYRYDSLTDVETVPSCTHVGLPGSTSASSREILDHFTDPTFSNNEGTDPFAGDWVEVSESDGPDTGAIMVRGGVLEMVLGKRAEVARAAVLGPASHPNRSGGVTLHGYAKHEITDDDTRLELQVSGDGGATYRTAVSFTSAQTNVGAFTADIGDVATDAFQLRLVETSDEDGAGSTVVMDYLRITWDDEITIGLSIGPLFRKDMRYDPRYGVVPTVTDWPTTGDKAAPVDGFWSTFTYHVYTSSKKVKGFDGWVMDPALIEADPNAPGMAYGFSPERSVRLVN